MHASELIKRISETTGTAAMVVVIDTKGSAPRHPGAKMLVFPDGGSIGTIGGGYVEKRVTEIALERIGTGAAGRVVVEMLGEQAVGDAPICGGTVTLAIFVVSDKTAFRAASARLEGGMPVVIVGSFEGTDAGTIVAVIDAKGHAEHGSNESIDRSAIRTALDTGLPLVSPSDGFLYDPVAPQDRLLILGGGHVGKALALFATNLEFRVCAGDSRKEFVDRGRFPAGTETRLGVFPDIVAGYPFGASTYVVVVSPSHSSDLECVRAILKRDYRYAGFMGSKRKTRMILDQVLSEGFPADKVDGLRAPIGMDVGAETPEELAIAILAEMIAVRRASPAIAAIDADRAKRRS
jgi:xanthine dehydrogenase accessory factor